MDDEYYSLSEGKVSSKAAEALRLKNANNKFNIMTIQKFVETYSTLDENGNLDVLDSAYSNDSRIDYQLSDYRVEAKESIKYLKTFDLDGFFAILKPEQLTDCINTGGKIVKVEELKYSSITNSFKRMLPYSGMGSFKSVKMVKYAELDSCHNMEILVCAAYQE